MPPTAGHFPLSRFSELWLEVNADLVSLVRAAFGEFPFRVGAPMEAGAAPWPSSESPSLLAVYAKVHGLIAGLGLVEGRRRRQELLLRLMTTAIGAWLRLMCDATGGRLRMPRAVDYPIFDFQRIAIGPLAGLPAQPGEMEAIIEDNEDDSGGQEGEEERGGMDGADSKARHDTAAVLSLGVDPENVSGCSNVLWEAEDSQQLWGEVLKRTRDAWRTCASKELFLTPPFAPVNEEEEGSRFGNEKDLKYAEQTAGVRAMLTLACHFHRLQDILSVVFLCLGSQHPNGGGSMKVHHYGEMNGAKDPKTKTRAVRNTAINELCRCIVGSFLKTNLKWISTVLKDITNFTIGREELDLLWSMPLMPHQSAVHPCCNGSLPIPLLRPSATGEDATEGEAPPENSKLLNANPLTSGIRQEPSSSLFSTRSAQQEGFQAPEGVSLKRVSCVYTMIEECGADDLLKCVVREVSRCCLAHGQRVANASVGALLYPPQMPLPVFPGEGRPTASPSFEKGGVAQANQALRGALQGFVRLRSALMMFNTGTTHYMDALTPHGRGLLIKGLKAFMDGLADGPAALHFAEQWGVAMWIQFCEETSSAKPRPGATVHGAKGHALPLKPSSLPTSDGARTFSPTKSSSPTLDVGRERAASSLGSFAEVISCSTNALAEKERDAWLRCATCSEPDPDYANGGPPIFPLEREGSELHEAALLPGDGLPTFLYLFARKGRARRHVLSCLAQRIHSYLRELLHSSMNDKPERTPHSHPKASFQPLPPNVFEMCVFMLKMTQTAFDRTPARDGRAINGIRGAGGRAAQDSFGGESSSVRDDIYPDARDFGGCAFQNLGETALYVLYRGLRSFFGEFEKSVCFTLAHALRAQVAENVKALYSADTKTTLLNPTVRSTKSVSAASFDVIGILLELTSLLPTKELFISFYQNLMVPCVFRLEKLARLEVEKEVVSRIVQCLGVSAGAPCLALLRDLSRAVSEVHQLEVRMKDEWLSRAWSRDPQQASSIPNGGGGPSETQQMLALAAAAAARAATLLPYNSLSRTLAAFTSCSSTFSGKMALQEIITQGHPLLRRVYFLCEAWWKPHISVTLSHTQIQFLFDKKGFFSQEFVDAVLRTVWYYSSSNYTLGDTIDRIELQPYPGYEALRTQGTHNRADVSSIASGNIFQGISSALTKTVQKGGNRIYTNLRLTKRRGGSFGNETSEEDNEDATNAHTGSSMGVSSPSEARWSVWPHAFPSTARPCRTMPSGGAFPFESPRDASASSSARQETTSQASTRRYDALPPEAVAWESRRLSWPMCGGRLTFILRPLPPSSSSLSSSSASSFPSRRRRATKPLIELDEGEGEGGEREGGGGAARERPPLPGSPVSSGVRVTGPPVVLLLLQLLDQGRGGGPPLITFDWLCAHMPVGVPKTIVGHLLHHLLRFGLIQREVHREMRQYGYWIPDQFSNVAASKITIDLTVPLQECGFAEMGFNYHAAYPTKATQQPSVGSGIEKGGVGRWNGGRSWRSSPKASCSCSMSFSEYQASQKSQTPACSLNCSEEDNNEHRVFITKLRRMELCIIETLKKSDTMSHSELFKHVAEKLQDRFPVSMSLFKVGISNLIEKEFIENKGHDVYAYLV